MMAYLIAESVQLRVSPKYYYMYTRSTKYEVPCTTSSSLIAKFDYGSYYPRTYVVPKLHVSMDAVNLPQIDNAQISGESSGAPKPRFGNPSWFRGCDIFPSDC